jgi:hypothetical protein
MVELVVVGSRLSFTSPVAVTHTLWAGCAANLSCGSPTPNVIAVSRREGTYFFTASNTNNATTNTVNRQFFFNGGEVVRVSTCGAEATGRRPAIPSCGCSGLASAPPCWSPSTTTLPPRAAAERRP